MVNGAGLAMATMDIIKLYGSMELAPLVGLADKIIDVVDTGNTLRANGLEPQELIATISSRLIVNKASMKMQHARIQSLIDTLRSAIEARHQLIHRPGDQLRGPRP